ncbi:putative orfan [Tupanvirus soda lake]|uniref:Orfan n=2 Tax=Tupanvirus TaxID=2094720 RepID=A0AC62ADH7_9VIRU|nr:putative orfan [Tupanvirus soda lake]QKU35822.1 putative orfan [Tupanvirus soda lake]
MENHKSINSSELDINYFDPNKPAENYFITKKVDSNKPNIKNTETKSNTLVSKPRQRIYRSPCGGAFVIR